MVALVYGFARSPCFRFVEHVCAGKHDAVPGFIYRAFQRGEVLVEYVRRNDVMVLHAGVPVLDFAFQRVSLTVDQQFA